MTKKEQISQEDALLSQLQEQLELVEKRSSPGGYLLASHHMEEVVMIYHRLNSLTKNKYKDEFIEAKKKLKKMNMSAQSEFKELQTSTSISKEDFDNEILKPFLDAKTLKEIFVGFSRMFIINKDNLDNITHNTKPIFLALCSVRSFDEKGNIIPGSDNGEKLWQKKMYAISLGVAQMMAIQVWDHLLENGKLNQIEILEEFTKRPLFSDQITFDKFQQGFNRFFLGDYVAAIHILVPTLESTIIQMMENFDMNTVGGRPSKTQFGMRTKTLTSEDILGEFGDKIGKNIALLINYVMFDELGMHMRHDVAHGNIGTDACNRQNCLLLIGIYMILWSKIEYKPI